MIDRTHPLSLTRQAAAFGISRSAVYCAPQATAPHDLALVRKLDALHLDFPCGGARMLRRSCAPIAQGSSDDGSAP